MNKRATARRGRIELNALVVAQSRGFEDHRAGLCSKHGQATVNDDSLVGRKTNHRAGLNDDLIGHADGVGAAEGLRPGPGGLGASLSERRLLDEFGYVCLFSRRNGTGHHGQKEKTNQKERMFCRGCALHAFKHGLALIERSPRL